MLALWVSHAYQEEHRKASREPLITLGLAPLEDPTFRAALVLREIEGLSYEEIAEILDISLGTVKSRILRGRDALRKQLAGRLEPASAPEWSVATGGISKRTLSGA